LKEKNTTSKLTEFKRCVMFRPSGVPPVMYGLLWSLWLPLIDVDMPTLSVTRRDGHLPRQ